MFMDIYVLVQLSIALHKTEDHRDPLLCPECLEGTILQELSPAAEDRAISLVSPLGEVIGDMLSGV